MSILSKADFTREEFSTVNVLVGPQVAFRCARMSTNGADIGFLTGVSPSVIGQVTLPCERVSTNFANKWPFARMNPAMSLHCSTLSKSSSTELTLEWFLSSVNSHVF